MEMRVILILMSLSLVNGYWLERYTMTTAHLYLIWAALPRVSNTDSSQGGGRDTKEVTTPKSPPPCHQGICEAHYSTLNSPPCRTMRGPGAPEAAPEAGWDWYGDPGDLAHPGLLLPDSHPQLPNFIFLSCCHQPITRMIPSPVMLKMENKILWYFTRHFISLHSPNLIIITIYRVVDDMIVILGIKSLGSSCICYLSI